MGFTPRENTRRIQAALAHTLANQSVEFNTTAKGYNVAVFDDPVDEFIPGRIRFFQRAIFNQVGAYPEIVKTAPACLKVFFAVEALKREGEAYLAEYFSSEDYSFMCSEVGIKYVQFAGKIYYPK